MTTRLLMAAATVAALTFAATAQAETLLFSYSEPGGISFSFEQSSNPTALSYSPGSETVVAVTDWTGSIGHYSSIQWYSLAASGMFDTADEAYTIFGAQVYSGLESNPTFAPGVFIAADQTDNLTGTLTVTAIPEPAAWTLMLVGFGALGLGLRASRKTLATA